MKTIVFLDNKYTTVYNLIIKNAQTRAMHEGYFEKHHIIPKSLGGSNDKDNLVKLTAREHFVCHRLLTKITSGATKAKMIFAMRRLAVKGNKHQSSRFVTTSRTYELIMKQARNEHSLLMKLHNPMKRADVIAKHSKAIAERGTTSGMTGQCHDNETKEKMRAKRKLQVITELTKQKLRDCITGTYKGKQNIPVSVNGTTYRSIGYCSRTSGLSIKKIKQGLESGEYLYASREHNE